ncbi:unnamed protein product [Oppiella nova]|uniref:Smoothelin domain-containing protein n=1 Tax=Oppiella nova TaxID=334625 RepID=A0A7R9R2T1_9ACAR|nr:unnamed protein product [Oppiella nova]CAG2183547.1 unnamed protein product [Oppiella nova]
MGDIEQEINLDEITDERVLQNLLDQTEDIDDRKAIRARIQELRAVEKGIESHLNFHIISVTLFTNSSFIMFCELYYKIQN